MTRTLRNGLLACAGVALLAGGIAVVAPATAQDVAVVDQRKALMRANGQFAYRAIPAFIRQGTGTADDVVKAAVAFAEAGKKIPTVFPAGTSATDIPGKTLAKPEIWQQRAAFDAAAQNLVALAGALEAAAKSGDKERIGQAFTTLNTNGCNGCHNQFRLPPPPRGG
jgi:cytochrome c556